MKARTKWVVGGCIVTLITIAVISLAGWHFGVRTISISDPRLAPMLQAIAASDRAALGFTSIPANAVVYLDSRPNTRRDAEIIVFDTSALYDGVYRNIEFRKTATGYRWIR